ncbi:autotransporter domain-containing protein [Martelella alba]|uniref:Autotransporter domain-containing protein n=1 Tax=Martelella alba TaxID=2590451 RepID=A0A506UGF7_9HYPH|nr:autotransporter outer membrane beta-barrel domain-containing protein [Martelella alba]TPW32415.1 autotransporter domain-containing protein [Martelella alba]
MSVSTDFNIISEKSTTCIDFCRQKRKKRRLSRTLISGTFLSLITLIEIYSAKPSYADTLYWIGTLNYPTDGTWATTVESWTATPYTGTPVSYGDMVGWPDTTGMTASFSNLNTGAIAVTVYGSVKFEKIHLDQVSGSSGDRSYNFRQGSLSIAPDTGTTSYIEGYKIPDLMVSSGLSSAVIIDGVNTAGELANNIGIIGGVSFYFGVDQQYTGTTSILDGSTLYFGGTNNTSTVLGGIILDSQSTLYIDLYAGDSGLTPDNVVSSAHSTDTDALLQVVGSSTVPTSTFTIDSVSDDYVGLTEVKRNVNVTGTGRIGGDVSFYGGTMITGTAGTTLGLGTSLTLNKASSASSDFQFLADLDQANSHIPLVSTGNLTLGGAITVNATGASGVYNIIQYDSGNLSGEFDPAAISISINGSGSEPYRLLTDGGMVRLVALDSSTGQISQYWNGSEDPADGGVLVGGSGTWNTSLANWTDSSASTNSERIWSQSVGVFGGLSAGIVTVSDDLNFDALQFLETPSTPEGYKLTGSGSLTFSPYSAGVATIDVAAGAKATIAVDMRDGSLVNSLEKTGGGSLVLTGQKSFSGDTRIISGALVLGDSSESGGLSSNVITSTDTTFGGWGSVDGDVTVVDGATLVSSQHQQTLTISGTLRLEEGATIAVNLDASAPNSNALFAAENLVLGGNGSAGLTLTVDSDGLPLTQGNYYLMTYSDGLTGSIKNIVPYVTVAASSEVNIVDLPTGNIYLSVSGPDMLYWNADSRGSTLVGGDGIWNMSNDNWTDDPPGSYSSWASGAVAVFAGTTAGTVQIDAGANPVSVSGLQFATDGYIIDGDSLTLTPQSGASYVEIAVNQPNAPAGSISATINSVLAGTAGIYKTGSGQLTLTGQNEYVGGTFISAGILAVEQDSNLGAAAGSVTLDGGTLQISTGFSTARDVLLGSGGGTIAVLSGTQVLAGSVDDIATASGALVKTGDGTLQLDHANGYSGGTFVLGGRLLVSDDANLGDAAGSITLNGGTLAITQGFDTSRSFALGGSGGTIEVAAGKQVLSGVLSDVASESGSLVKTGNGSLVLTAMNSYSGGTTIAAGELQLGDGAHDGAISGDVDVKAGAKFNVLDLGTFDYAGQLSGEGAFNLSGSGTTTLTGDSSAFEGITTVADGLLNVTGRLGGSIFVPSGILGGSGSLGDVSIGSGGSIIVGTTTDATTMRTGSLDFASGSSLYVNWNEDGTHDEIIASDAVSIAGGTVYLTTNGKGFSEGEQITIISSSASVTTTDGDGDGTLGFDREAKMDSAYLTADVAYTDSTVLLYISQIGDGTFCLDGMTENQCNTGNGVYGLGPDNPLYGIIQGLSDDEAGPALDQLSGEIYSTIDAAIINNSRYVREATSRRIYQAQRDSEVPGHSQVSNYADEPDYPAAFGQMAKASDENRMFWAAGYGSWNTLKSNGNAAKMDNPVGGIFMGGDIPLFDTMRFGIVAGYGHSDYKVDSRNSSASSNDYTIGLYGGGTWDAVDVSVGTAYSWSNVSAERQISFSGLNEQDGADYSVGLFQLYGDVGYRVDVATDLSIEPYLGAAYIYQNSESFSENGGVAALMRDSADRSVGLTNIGVRTAYDLGRNLENSQLAASIGWRHAYGNLDQASHMQFVGGSPFDIVGLPVASDQAVFTLGFSSKLNARTDVEIGYTGLFGDGVTSQNITGRLSLRF